ncbi:MAG TPA: hypothetical protein VHL31_06445 [Geminicoccus sp.]|uniref:hypothetical protein n=1 Tax=Geminicoccus sp. TaxID=2024832 RepID=UPI002E3715BA|nr:hypothetical protein [Geminicoccus sp.]HEX2525931.1 hypothetical protein [Geminicoccus sp.]
MMMTDPLRASTNLSKLMTASAATINARVARMAADPAAIAGDPETLRMVTEKVSAMSESAAKGFAALPAWGAAWQRWWLARAFSFGHDAMVQADRRLVADLNRVVTRTSASMQTPFRRRAVANAARFKP